MIVDEVVIKVKAGDGGDGAVAFDKNMMAKGAAGGSGGRGGSIYFEGVSDLTTLNQFRFKKDVKAENGGIGRGQWRDGKNGSDLILKVPVGTVITNLETNTSKEITKINELVLIAKGGRGGKGNFLFRSPKNTSPKQFQEGFSGESLNLKLELKMIADVGLIGLPNAGKSSLLNRLTSAKAKIGNYAFTTLQPNLGVYYDLIIADIPGLIEGASEGKGLGSQFLRHIERTNYLIHLISADSEDVVKDYQTVKKELKKYNSKLDKKKEIVLISKADNKSPAEIEEYINALKKIKIQATPISILDDESIMKLEALLREIIKDKTN